LDLHPSIAAQLRGSWRPSAFQADPILLGYSLVTHAILFAIVVWKALIK
jgi:hypothetical protein